ncbi:MAG: sigma-70 family RNA polymerase sigma factor [Deltaproteobacteria bacterium]|nr:MAG: sigma-70 family RNA polymerase sigma factor [Deltaproteobacteria bacterium]
MSRPPLPDLLTAWASLKDPDASDAVRKPALQRVFDEIVRVAKATTGIDERDDITLEAFEKIERALRAPSNRGMVTRTEGGVRSYVRKTLRSLVADHHAEAHRLVRDVVEETPAATDAPDEPESELIERFEAEVVAPFARRRRADREGTLPSAVREMVALRRGERTVADLLGLPEESPDFERARAALYQRHCVARRELLGEIDRRERRGLLCAEDAEVFRAIVDWLRRRRRATARRRP